MSYSVVLGGDFRTTTVGTVESSQISLWLEELVAMAPGATNNTLKLAIRTSFREFCVRSGAWNREIAAISLEEGVAGYEIPPQDDANVLYILNMFWLKDAAQYGVIPPAQAPYHNLMMREPSTRPQAFVGDMEAPQTFTLIPTPKESVEDAIKVFVALGPKDPHIDDIPTFFTSHHFDTLLDGAAHKLYAQPNKPYTNMVLAQFHGRKFNKAIANARDVARRQFTTAEHTWSFPRWA